jgi:CheY-like chemotaxis protein
MKILVIDDSPWNVASAHFTLKGHDYQVVDNIKDAYDILRTGEKFDVVLTDLWLPRGEFSGAMARHRDEADTMIPAGLVFAIRAMNDGMKVIICTDSDHHKDRLCSLLDLLNEGTYGKEKAISFVEARECCLEASWVDGKIVLGEYQTPYIKDWSEVLKTLDIPHRQ